MTQSPNSVPTTSMVTFTQKINVAIPMKDSKKKQPSDVVDTSMPREKVGAHVKALQEKMIFLLIKRGRKGHVLVLVLLH